MIKRFSFIAVGAFLLTSSVVFASGYYDRQYSFNDEVNGWKYSFDVGNHDPDPNVDLGNINDAYIHINLPSKDLSYLTEPVAHEASEQDYIFYYALLELDHLRQAGLGGAGYECLNVSMRDGFLPESFRQLDHGTQVIPVTSYTLANEVFTLQEAKLNEFAARSESKYKGTIPEYSKEELIARFMNCASLQQHLLDKGLGRYGVRQYSIYAGSGHVAYMFHRGEERGQEILMTLINDLETKSSGSKNRGHLRAMKQIIEEWMAKKP